MAVWVVILLLPVAAWSGWWVAMRKEARAWRQDRSRSAYVEGLSYLLNDQADKAVDVFVAIAEFDEQTTENQLTLGRLFRRRGEIDRALHLHKQLEQRTPGDAPQMDDILFELGEDYRSAGMFAQAQAAYEALLERRPQQRVLSRLLALYERTEQWQKAQDIAERWQDSGYGSQHHALANHHCELANIARADGVAQGAYRHVQTALALDSDCIRAHDLLARYHLADKDYVQALYALQAIATHKPQYLPDVLPLMSEAYIALQREDEYKQWLKNTAARTGQVRLLTAIADALAALGDHQTAHDVLSTALAASDSPLLIWACLQHGVDIAQRGQAIMAAIKPQTLYQCSACGFRQHSMCWHCPSCFAWGSYSAVLGLHVEQR